jgi:hypothetical protein
MRYYRGETNMVEVEQAFLKLYNYIRDLEVKLERATDLIEDKSR